MAENKTPGTVPQPAPVSPFTIERQGANTEPMTRRLPQIRGGICEFCSTMNPHARSEDQYKFCPHFRGVGEIRCSYCPATANVDEVNYKSILNIAVHPDNPSKLIVWCNSTDCVKKHRERFIKS